MTATDRATNVSTATFTVIRDTTPPQVWLEVPHRVTTATIPLTWGAEDTQSGIARYDVQVSVEDGDWTDWLTGTLETEATYVAEEGEWFAFRVIATDNVSNAGSAEATSSLVRVTKYYYHGGQRVAMRQVGPESGSVVYYLHGDHLGSTSLTTDASGAVVARQLYHPYGTVRAHQGTLPTDYQYTGQRAEDFGLYDYHARYYDGAIGRFISADTIVPQAGNPQALNRYSYVIGNPLRHIDPSGHGFILPPGLEIDISGWDEWAVGALRVALFVLGGQTSVGEDSLKVVPSLSVPCGADFVIAPAAPIVSSLANVADDAVAQAADDAAARVTNAAADATTRARISYDPSLSAGTGATDKLGNIRVSPYGSALDRSRVLLHEKVHRFFTPRGPLQAPRANFNMWAYKNSHLLQYTEEAIAESTAQLLTGGSLKEGLLFPFTHGYVDPWRVGLEATSLGGVLVGGAWVVDRTAEEEK